jgi:hypothetical protein
VTDNVLEWLKAPLVAVRVSGYVPTGTVEGKYKDRFANPLAVIVVGENEAVAPDGSPEIARVTVPANVFSGDT